MTMNTLITDALFIDGTGGAPRPRTTIEIIDGRIGRIGRREDFGADLPLSDRVIAADGRAVVPGLINAHEHITWRRAKGSFTERVGRVPSESLLAKGVGNCLISLIEGVTTIRDVGARDHTSLALKKAVAAGVVVGPRIFTCGQVLVMTGGHAHDGGRMVDGVEGLRRAARELLFEGADLIKLMASGGYVSIDRDLPTSPQYTVGEMRAAFDEAHDQGKRTTVHCHAPEGIRRAVEAGVDCIEHAGLLDAPTAELLAKRNVFVDPTLNALHSMIKYGPQFDRAPAEVERSKTRLEQSWKSFGAAKDAGVRICAGVDSLGSLFEEIELFVQGGMSPLQALTATTKTNSEVLGAADRVGTLETGKYADMLVVRGNPAENIRDLRNIDYTIKGGVAFRPQELLRAVGPALWFDSMPASGPGAVEDGKLAAVTA